MFSAPVPVRSDSSVRRSDESERAQSARLLEGELLDLYVAMLIVVPAAIFLKSLWF